MFGQRYGSDVQVLCALGQSQRFKLRLTLLLAGQFTRDGFARQTVCPHAAKY